MNYTAISPHLKRAVLVAEDIAFFSHHGFELAEVRQAVARAIEDLAFADYPQLDTMLPGVRQELSQAMESRLKELRGLKRRLRTGPDGNRSARRR